MRNDHVDFSVPMNYIVYTDNGRKFNKKQLTNFRDKKYDI